MKLIALQSILLLSSVCQITVSSPGMKGGVPGGNEAADDPQRAAAIALANALHSGDAKAALALFDPAMPGFGRLRADVSALLAAAEADLAIDPQTGVWTLDLTSRDTAGGSTHRQAKVLIATRGGLIESVKPADFLAPPHGREAWDALAAFASDLQNQNAPPSMSQFDPAAPGFDALKNNVAALWNQFQIEASFDLLSNQGSDTGRTLEVDCTLTLNDPQGLSASITRRQTVTCGMRKEGGRWRIVSLTPAGLFVPAR